MAEPLAETDDRRRPGIARTCQTEPSAPPAGGHGLQRRDDSRVDPDPRERSMQPGELDRAIIRGGEVL
jgi:hypothetical protein